MGARSAQSQNGVYSSFRRVQRRVYPPYRLRIIVLCEWFDLIKKGVDVPSDFS